MPKTKELCEATKADILALLEIGMSERQVVKKLKISKTAVHYTKKKQAQHGSTKLLAGQETSFYPPDDRHSSVPVSGIVVRPPGTLKMSGHCGEM